MRKKAMYVLALILIDTGSLSIGRIDNHEFSRAAGNCFLILVQLTTPLIIIDFDVLDHQKRGKP